MAPTRCHSAVADEDVADGMAADSPGPWGQEHHVGPMSAPKSGEALVHHVADGRELRGGWHMRSERPLEVRAAQHIHTRQKSREADDTIDVLCGYDFPLP